MKDKDLFEVYKLTSEEERYFLTEHQARIKFFLGIITTIYGGIVVGVFNASSTFQWAILFLAPILPIFLARTAKEGTERIYQRFLETITTRAKLESRMGLSTPPVELLSEGGWAVNEQIIPERHRKSRLKASSSSEDWVNDHLNYPENYHGVMKSLFNWVIYISIVSMSLIGYQIFVELKC